MEGKKTSRAVGRGIRVSQKTLIIFCARDSEREQTMSRVSISNSFLAEDVFGCSVLKLL